MTTRTLLAGLAILVATMMSTSSAHAQFGFGNEPTADSLVDIDMMFDVDQIVPGHTFHLAVVARIAPQWHIYWKHPGESGMQTLFDVTAPEGFDVGAARYPRPRQYTTPDGRTNGYSREAVFLIPVKAPADLAPGEKTFKIRVDFLVCKEKCYLGDASKTLTINASSDPAATPGEPAEVIRKHLPRFPIVANDASDVSVEFDGTTLRVSGPAGDRAEVGFLPVPVNGVNFSSVDASIQDGRFMVVCELVIEPRAALGKPMRVEGLVTLGSKLRDPCFEILVPLDESGRPSR